MVNRAYILNYLKSNKSYFKEKYNIIKIGIFGSYSRDEQTEKSDIDIIVEFEEDTMDLFDKKYELQKYLKSIFNKDIDLCREGAIKPMFKPIILKDVIYV